MYVQRYLPIFTNGVMDHFLDKSLPKYDAYFVSNALQVTSLGEKLLKWSYLIVLVYTNLF